jgi:hypothetical protein
VADTSLVGESATLLADLQARLRQAEDARRRSLRRIYAGIAVAILHVLIVLLLLSSQWLPVDILKVKEVAPLQWVTLQAPVRAMEEKIRPKSPNVGTVDPSLIPKILRPKTEQEESNAISDFGLALGRSLACGANSYEWLNPKRRAECQHKPWEFVYDRYGNIVLDARPRVVQDQETLRPSDVQAHERNTAPVCPTNIDPNAPCLSSIIGGHR